MAMVSETSFDMAMCNLLQIGHHPMRLWQSGNALGSERGVAAPPVRCPAQAESVDKTRCGSFSVSIVQTDPAMPATEVQRFASRAGTIEKIANEIGKGPTPVFRSEAEDDDPQCSVMVVERKAARNKVKAHADVGRVCRAQPTTLPAGLPPVGVLRACAPHARGATTLR